MSKTRDDEKMVEAIRKGGGNHQQADKFVTNGWPLPGNMRGQLIKGLTASGMNNTDAIKEIRRLEARNRLGRR